MAAGVRIDGRDAALAALGAVVTRIEHARPMFEEIGAKLVESTQQRFEDQAGPGGYRWPETVRQRYEPGARILIRSGKLKNQITADASDTSVAVGSNAVQAAIQQFGGTIRPKKGQFLRFRPFGGNRDVFVRQVTIPARPFLGLDDGDEAAIIRIAGEHVGGGDAGR